MALIGWYFSSMRNSLLQMTYAAFPGTLHSFFTGRLLLELELAVALVGADILFHSPYLPSMADSVQHIAVSAVGASETLGG